MSAAMEALKQRIYEAHETILEGPMEVTVAETLKVTVGELKAAVKENPEHPKATVYNAATMGLSDKSIVVVEKADLQGLLEDKDVYPTRTVENGRVVVRKALAEKDSDYVWAESPSTFETED